MPARLNISGILDQFRPGMTVFLPGMSGESKALFDALSKAPDKAQGVRFVTVAFPGINSSDFLGLSPTSRLRAYFMSPSVRNGLRDGRAELLPLDYPGIYRDIQQLPDIDIAILQVSPPDERGNCSVGISCDFQPAAWSRAKRRFAHINPSMPRTSSVFETRYEAFDAVFEHDQPLVTYDAGVPDAATLAHGQRVADIIRDGDILEFGVGKLQSAILAGLKNHRSLRIWSGMASAPIATLLDAGVISPGPESVNIGVALGDRSFYERAAADPAFRFRPVSQTHSPGAIGRLEKFTAVNSAVEIDLFGQVNADCTGQRLIAGVGGLPAFVSGALQSSHGRSIIAMPAATEGGRSRIVARLSGPGLAALPRHVADWIVTEHGAVCLRGMDLTQRAQALIGIAAPQHRAQLENDWSELLHQL